MLFRTPLKSDVFWCLYIGDESKIVSKRRKRTVRYARLRLCIDYLGRSYGDMKAGNKCNVESDSNLSQYRQGASDRNQVGWRARFGMVNMKILWIYTTRWRHEGSVSIGIVCKDSVWRRILKTGFRLIVL